MTRIEWTDRTWNPTVGCSVVSPGCDGCYAATAAHRGLAPAHRGLTVRTEQGTDWTGEVRCLPARLPIPLRRRTPTRWFVDSMSDLFHPQVPDEFIAQVFAVMHEAGAHTFQVLTKRPQRMAALLSDITFYGLVLVWVSERRHRVGQLGTRLDHWPLPNVWLGTSIEADRYTWRADWVRRTPAAVRWLSLEPLLGPVPSLDLGGIDWVVVGGESGPGARPMHPDWVRDIRDRCQAAGTAFFFKQWGQWAPAGSMYTTTGRTHLVMPDGTDRGVPWGGWKLDQPDAEPMYRFGKSEAGRELDGRIWHEYPTGVAR